MAATIIGERYRSRSTTAYTLAIRVAGHTTPAAMATDRLAFNRLELELCAGTLRAEQQADRAKSIAHSL